MGIELSTSRKKAAAAKRTRNAKASAVGGPVVIRQVGDPVPEVPPPSPAVSAPAGWRGSGTHRKVAPHVVSKK